MGIEMLQSYIETNCPSACVPVDLFKVARNMAQIGHTLRPPITEYRVPFEHAEYGYSTPLCLVLDAETCLDRLYGGFFGDWVCGGQWNRMVDFLSNLFDMLSRNNIEVTMFFNGANEIHRMEQWIEKQKSDKEKITQVLRHVAVKGTPPPKVWWVPPNCLRSALLLALRNLKVTTFVSFNDHHQEVMSYLRDHRFHGLIASGSEYFIFDPPMLFNSQLLKLTFKGCLETKEYVFHEITRCLSIHPSRLCIVAALLVNHILSDNDLASFHHYLCPEIKGKIPSSMLIKAVIDFVRDIASVDDLDVVSDLVFGALSPEKSERFRRCVFYYSRSNRHAMRFTTSSLGFSQSIKSSGSRNTFEDNQTEAYDISASQKKTALNSASSTNSDGNTTSNVQINNNQDDGHSSKFASETTESEVSSREAYTAILSKSEHPSSLYEKLSHLDDSAFLDSGPCIYDNHCKDDLQLSQGAQNSDSNIPGSCSGSLEATIQGLNLNCKGKKSACYKHIATPPLPKVSMDVLQFARDRHGKGLMNPAIYQIFTQGEIKIPTTFEDDITGELPSPSLLFRPLRQMVYGILFNHHHRQFLLSKKEDKEDEVFQETIVKEWVWNKSNKYNKPDLVPSLPLGWSVPTVSRLWFGQGPEYNKKRLHAFLTCMRSDSRLMRNINYVPQPHIILCCVLRYMMTSPEGCILRKQELDAFLVQAVNPQLTDISETQKLELPMITARGVQLGALFMQGVENAMIANDACGAPIPWLMCCPWLFFDGKIFHRMLLKALGAKNLIELCDNRIDEVAKIERMRNAILEDLPIQFAIPGNAAHRNIPPPPNPYTSLNLQVPSIIPRGRGISSHQRVVPRGGQLEVAGVVVGSWGPNYGQGPRSPSRNIPPQIVSVGGATRGRGSSLGLSAGTGRAHIPKPGGLAASVKTKSRGSDGKPPNLNDSMRLYQGLGRGATIENKSEPYIYVGRGKFIKNEVFPKNISVISKPSSVIEMRGKGHGRKRNNARKLNTVSIYSTVPGSDPVLDRNAMIGRGLLPVPNKVHVPDAVLERAAMIGRGLVPKAVFEHSTMIGLGPISSSKTVIGSAAISEDILKNNKKDFNHDDLLQPSESSDFTADNSKEKETTSENEATAT